MSDAPTPDPRTPPPERQPDPDDVPETPPTEPQPVPVRDPPSPPEERGPYVVRMMDVWIQAGPDRRHSSSTSIATNRMPTTTRQSTVMVLGRR